MAKFEIELDDTRGELLGDPPEAFKAWVEKERTMSYGNGFKNGGSETKTSLAKQFEETLKAERTKWDALAPMERAKFGQMEEETKALNSRFTQAITEHTKTLREREEAHAREITARSEALKVREQNIREIVGGSLEFLAMSFGAREESLPELNVILKNYIGYTDDAKPFVKDADGNPRLVGGKPLELKAFVKEYLDGHPHHRKPSTGVGGGARGGASFHGVVSDPATVTAVQQRIAAGDRSTGAINDLFEASRRKAG